MTRPPPISALAPLCALALAACPGTEDDPDAEVAGCEEAAVSDDGGESPRPLADADPAPRPLSAATPADAAPRRAPDPALVEAALADAEGASVDGPAVERLADLFEEAALAGDADRVAFSEAVEARMTEEARRAVGEALARRYAGPARAKGVEDGVPALVEVPDCAFPVALRYTPLGIFASVKGAKLAREIGTTTACGGDVDGSLHFDAVEGAWDAPESLVAWETSLVRYGALLATHGGTLAAYRLESDDDVHVCVDGGISGSATGGAAAVLLVTNLWVGTDPD